jgi:hypothetical protein
MGLGSHVAIVEVRMLTQSGSGGPLPLTLSGPSARTKRRGAATLADWLGVAPGVSVPGVSVPGVSVPGVSVPGVSVMVMVIDLLGAHYGTLGLLSVSVVGPNVRQPYR